MFLTQFIENGDYVKCDDKAGLKSVDYIDEIMQNIKLILTAQRGKFYPDKKFGSYLKELADEPKEEYALNFSRQAVSSIDGVYIKSAEIIGEEIIFKLIVNEEERQVSMNFENNIQ